MAGGPEDTRPAGAVGDRRESGQTRRHGDPRHRHARGSTSRHGGARASVDHLGAVLIERDSYHGRYLDLPVGYINSTRILNALVHRGWPPDHILLVRDNPDRALLRHATDWLTARVHPGDVALLYVAGEYQFFERELAWDATFPGLWERVSTSRRVLIVEACFAERLTKAVKGIPGFALPAVGRDELDWWGLRETGRLIRGGSFTYFLARALESQPVDMPADFAGAFVAAVAGAQEYFRAVIASTPEALNSFHARNSYPENLTTFPNPHLLKETGDPAVRSSPSDPQLRSGITTSVPPSSR